MKHFLIFTDLDGTLLDHESYQWAKAEPALSRIKALKYPLVLSSSKTAAEIFTLRAQLGNHHPFIVENGGAVGFSAAYFGTKFETSGQSGELIRFGQDYTEIVGVLNQIRTESGYKFRGFSDMDAQEVSRTTGLSLDDAKLAKKRESTEPLLWLDNAKLLEEFKAALAEHGLGLTRGGRFYHVAGQTDKLKGVKWLIRQFNLAWPEREFVTVALGDGPNDIGMLEAVDIAVVMKSVTGSVLQLKTGKRVIYAEEPGPEGWCLAIERILGKGSKG